MARQLIIALYAWPALVSLLLCSVGVLLGAIRRHERERVGDASSMAFLCGWCSSLAVQLFVASFLVEYDWPSYWLYLALPAIAGGIVSYKMARYLVATNIS